MRPKNGKLEVRTGSSSNELKQFLWGEGDTDDLILKARGADANGSLNETLYEA